MAASKSLKVLTVQMMSNFRRKFAGILAVFKGLFTTLFTIY